MARKSRIETRSSTRRRSTSASSVRLTGFGTTLRTVAGANCSSSSRRRCVSARPRKSAARARRSSRGDLARRATDGCVVGRGPRGPARRAPAPRSSETRRRCRAGRPATARTRGRGGGRRGRRRAARGGRGRAAQALACGPRPSRSCPSSRSGARSSEISMLQGTTIGTKARASRRGRRPRRGLRRVALLVLGTICACARAPRRRAPPR